MSHAPTDEQVHILDLAKGTEDNLILNAYAGCGKTTTLEMVERVVKAKPILYLVFNKRNAEEAKGRMLSTTTVRTLNGMGHRVWSKTVGRQPIPNAKKSNEILRTIIDDSPKDTRSILWEVYWEVISGVAMAKALGYVPEGKFEHAKRLISREDFHQALEERPDELVGDLIDAVLTTSIKQAYEGKIDYNDQIYMPALFGGTYPRFPLVMVDEAQDLSPANHELLQRLVRGRILAVGDPAQSIYGFRGAFQQGMSALQGQYVMSSADLSVSFRCPQAIVENARWRVPQFKWIKPGGHVEVLKTLPYSGIPDNAAIICRNNAPLFRLALHLLSAKRSVSVAGSEIGPKIIGMMKRLGDESMTQASVNNAIDDWLAEKLAKESTTARDLAECMKVFASFGKTLGQALSYAEHLFDQRGSIRLLTGHKAKGLEFNHVIHLDPWLIKDGEQEDNLRYVIQTRSADKYFEINSPQLVVA